MAEELYEPVIGLEVHAQVLTNSKMFCGCAADYTNKPANSNTCPICLGMPGTLPVPNAKAIEQVIRTGLAMNGQISKVITFDRKNYFYPDLPKGYQITQLSHPLVHRGHLEFPCEGEFITYHLDHIHLEEDTGTLLHEDASLENSSTSLVNFNRSGIPLMEIVGMPDLYSAAAAREFLINLHQLLMNLGVNSGNLEEGAFRCDANVSIRKKGTSELGTKVEVKNMNSFKAVYKAITYEIKRQTELLNTGGKIVQETRGWSEAKGESGETFSQRSKEQAHDYRYFPEPDISISSVPEGLVKSVAEALPELPLAKIKRFNVELNVPLDNAKILVFNKDLCTAFEAIISGNTPAPLAAKWIVGELASISNEQENFKLEETKMGLKGFSEILELIDQKVINNEVAKNLLRELMDSSESPKAVVKSRGLGKITDVDALDRLLEQAIKANPKAVEDYLQKGKTEALGAIMGLVMKESSGKADAQIAREMLLRKLREEVEISL